MVIGRLTKNRYFIEDNIFESYSFLVALKIDITDLWLNQVKNGLSKNYLNVPFEA